MAEGGELRLHLITEKDELPRENLDNWLVSTGLGDAGYQYGVVAVLGCQSSGKSTILNLMFGTNFDVMQAEYGRSQTTKGIWAGKSKWSNLVVLDVEGTDGRERGQDKNFERKSSLFSLAVAQILIVNIWMHDIGRHQGANHPLLRTVFELNLRLFHKQEKKNKPKLLFLIRDHVFTPVETLADTIKKDLAEIWSQIDKPEGFEDSKVDQFFEPLFECLPAKPHQPQEFEEAALKLRERFNNREDATSLFPSNEPDFPMDGFPTYCTKIWDVISHNKDLDIPNELEMLAVVRCDELLGKAMEYFTKETQTFHQSLEVESKLVDNFGPTISALISHSLELYDEQAKRYNTTISRAKRDALVDKLMETGLVFYLKQLEVLRLEVFETFKSEVVSALPEAPTPCKDFMGVVGGAMQQAQEKFCERAVSANLVDVSVTPPYQWSVDKDTQVLRKRMEEFGETKKQDHLNRVENASGKEIREILRPVEKEMEKVDGTMWERVRNALHEGEEKYFSELSGLLKTSFNCSEEETASFLKRMTLKVKETVIQMLKSKKNMIHYQMEKTFEVVFRHDADGLPRRWTPADDPQRMFKDAINQAGEVMDQWAIIRLEEKQKSTSIFDEKYDEFHTEDDFVLTQDEAKELFRKFKKEVEADYSNALREQETVASKNQLPVFWILLIFVFAYDEVKWVVSNPTMVLLIVIIAGIVGVGYKLGLAPIVVPVVLDAYKNLLARIGTVLAGLGGDKEVKKERKKKKEKKEKPKEE